jgi:hypothetical protein
VSPGVPVVNGEGLVLGVVSEADLIVKAASKPEGSGVLWSLFVPEAVDERHLAATTASEAMTYGDDRRRFGPPARPRGSWSSIA